jgi:hypothetical protein
MRISVSPSLRSIFSFLFFFFLFSPFLFNPLSQSPLHHTLPSLPKSLNSLIAVPFLYTHLSWGSRLSAGSCRLAISPLFVSTSELDNVTATAAYRGVSQNKPALSLSLSSSLASSSLFRRFLSRGRDGHLKSKDCRTCIRIYPRAP